MEAVKAECKEELDLLPVQPLPIEVMKAESNEEADTIPTSPVSTSACIQSTRIGNYLTSRNSSITQTHSPPQVMKHGPTLMPVNIKQIADAWLLKDNAVLLINNTVASSLKMIGRVTDKKVDEYKGTFTVDDCTGKIKASLWFTNGREELDHVQEGAYAMVVGRVRADLPTPELLCYVCRPVTDFNAITHHHLSVIATHIDLVHRPAKPIHSALNSMCGANVNTVGKGSAHIMPPGPRKATNKQADTIYLSPEVQSQVNPKQPDAGSSTVGVPTSDAIMRILRKEAIKSGPQGVHIDVICSSLMTTPQTLRHYLDDLEKAGELYSTVDCDHLAPT